MIEGFRFLIDEVALRLAASAGTAELSGAFENLVALIQETRAHSIGKFSCVWEEPLAQHPLCEWLFDPALGIDPVAASALQIALSRTPDWDATLDTTGLPLDVSIDGVTHQAPSASAAARETHGGHATGCLSALPGHSGQLRVIAGGLSAMLHFVATPADILAFFREVPEVEHLDEQAYFQNAKFAFPDVIFVRERTRFGHFDERYETIRRKVSAHLAVLNDHARTILRSQDVPAAKQAKLGSHGVNASEESPQTRADADAMKQRRVDVDGRSIVCDWHTKIRPDKDRIYFNATSVDKVVVGVFRDHLD